MSPRPLWRRTRLTGAALLTFASCGGDLLTLGRAPLDDPDSGIVEAGPDVGMTDGGTDADAADSGDATAPIFISRGVITGLSKGPRDENATLTADRQQIFFMSTRALPEGGGPNNNNNIWSARWIPARGNEPATWGEPFPVDAANTDRTEQSPAISPDGRTLWFARRDVGEGDPPGLEIYVTTRSDPNSETWALPVLVAELSGDATDEIPRPPARTPWIMPLASRPLGENNYQNYLAVWDSTGSRWNTPFLMEETYDPTAESVDGFITDDGLAFYFTSNRGGGRQDIYYAVRSSTNERFTGIAPIAGDVNTATCDERDPWVSPDGHWLYYASNCEDMRYQIFWAERQ
jgi:hypothetical protein